MFTPYRADYEAQAAKDAEAAAEFGFAAFDAAEILGLITDRGEADWVYLGPDAALRARDVLRAALVSTIMLIGGDGSTVAARMEQRFRASPEAAAVRAALLRGEPVPESALVGLYQQATKESV